METPVSINQNKNEFLSRMTSKTKKVSRNEIVEQLKEYKPHPILNSFEATKWIKKRLSTKCIERSINTLMPNNNKPEFNDEKIPTDLQIYEEDDIDIIKKKEEEKDKILNKIQNRKQREFIDDHCKPYDKYKNYDLNPKNLFTTDFFLRMKKLRDIFVQFDTDGSRKMDLEELEEMFKINKIPTDRKELTKLFFKDKLILNGEKAALDYFSFMTFALNKDSDQYFRDFMRNIKHILDKNYSKMKKKQEAKDWHNTDQVFNEEDAKETVEHQSEETENKHPGYFPMNFNAILEYFNINEIDREHHKKISTAISHLSRYINRREKDLEKKEKIKKGPKLSMLRRLSKISTIKLDRLSNNHIDIDDLEEEWDDLTLHEDVQLEQIFNSFLEIFKFESRDQKYKQKDKDLGDRYKSRNRSKSHSPNKSPHKSRFGSPVKSFIDKNDQYKLDMDSVRERLSAITIKSNLKSYNKIADIINTNVNQDNVSIKKGGTTSPLKMHNSNLLIPSINQVGVDKNTLPNLGSNMKRVNSYNSLGGKDSIKSINSAKSSDKNSNNFNNMYNTINMNSFKKKYSRPSMGSIGSIPTGYNSNSQFKQIHPFTTIKSTNSENRKTIENVSFYDNNNNTNYNNVCSSGYGPKSLKRNNSVSSKISINHQGFPVVIKNTIQNCYLPVDLVSALGNKNNIF